MSSTLVDPIPGDVSVPAAPTADPRTADPRTADPRTADPRWGPSSRLAGREQARGRRRRVACAVVLGLIVAGVLAAGAFRATGGRWFVVRTPSMGTTAPVGTLVLTRPVEGDDLRVGQVIAFHPPAMPGAVFTHRIVAVVPGGVRTRGDINGATDPWTVRPSDVVGRATVIAPYWGWLARALPLFVIGGLVLAALCRLWVPRRHRAPVLLMGSALLFTVAAWVLKPFVNVVQLTVATRADGTAQMALVSTGILPIRVTALPGHGHATPVSLAAGQVGVTRLTDPPAHGGYALAAHLHLSLTGWVVIGVLWSLPLVWSLTFGLRRASRESVAGDPVTSEHGRAAA